MRGSRTIRLSGATGCAALVLSIATEARADDDIPTWGHVFINPGAVWVFTEDPIGASGPGFELSAGYTWLLSGDSPEMFFMPHVGGVFRVNQISDEDGRPAIGYLTAGVEGGFSLVGLEVTYARRGQSASDPEIAVPRQEGIGLAPYLSLGLFTIGPQWIFPLTGTSRDPELGMHVGIKIPIMQIALGAWALSGMWDNIPSGRPLRSGGVALRPAARMLPPAWQAAGEPSLEASVLTEHWLSAAGLERAAVSAFRDLARDLERLGAGDDLVAWAERACADEERHAEACLALVAELTGRRWALEPLAPPVKPPGDLEQLAVESLVDGCWAEGVAAALARSLADRAGEPITRRTLETIAREEGDHAELAWAVIRFALASGGEPVRQALELAVGRVLSGGLVGIARRAELGAAGGLARLGVPDQAILARAEIEVALDVAERLEALLARARPMSPLSARAA